MPIPIPGPAPDEATPVARPATPAPPGTYSLTQAQGWAVTQERMHHDQALYLLGEWCFFVLMWSQIDFEAGDVARCSRCWPDSDALEHRLAEVYEQPRQNECPVCFGTSFEGGYRARIVRPSIVTDAEETAKLEKRGVIHPADTNVQTTADFRCREGDFMIRADGSRWSLTSIQRTMLRAGFAHASQEDEAVGLQMRATRQEDSTVAYKIPPLGRSLIRAVLAQPMHIPGSFIEHEDQRGELIPPVAKLD